jgi:hypothetical protein
VVENIFKFEYTLSSWQYKGVLTLLHKGEEREDIHKTGDHWPYWIVIIK